MTTPRDLLAEAARAETARVYGTTCPENRQTEPAGPSRIPFQRPEDSYYGPAPAVDLTELVNAIVPAPSARRRSRVRVEQAIARGLNDASISAELDVDTDYAATVRAAMEKASA
jgi:hypothetical protein